MTNNQFFALTFLVMFATWDMPPGDAPVWMRTLSAVSWLVMFVAWAVFYFAAIREQCAEQID